MRFSYLWCGLGAMFLFFHSGCQRQSSRFPDAPVILITIDTLRSDHLPVYGYQGVQTPAIDRLAADSVVFENAFAHVPLTLPSHASMFTGVWPPFHGIRDNLGFSLDDSFETLAERLKKAGYRTGAVVSSMVLRKTTGIAQGFDTYDDQMKRGNRRGIVGYAERRGDMSLSRAQSFLEKQQDGKFFLWLHLYDPHFPYQAPPPFQGQTDHPYDDEIAFTDHLMDQLMASLKEKGFYDEAIIVFTSDHGEGLGEHGEQQHGLLIYREAMQVPLTIKLPNSAQAGSRQARLVGLADLAPTISHLVDQEPLGDGLALFSSKKMDDRIIYGESFNAALNFGWIPQQSAIQHQWHYIKGSQEHLFHLEKDPAELDDLIGSQPVPPSARSMIDDIGGEVGQKGALSQEEEALLHSLGYTGTIGDDTATLTLSEPDFLKLFNIVGECNIRLNRGQFSEVEQILTPIVSRFPNMLDARLGLGTALVRQGKLVEAEALYLESLALSPKNLTTLVSLVETELALGKMEEAQTLIEKAVNLAPKLGPRLLLPVLDHHAVFPLAETMARNTLKVEPDDTYAMMIAAKGAIGRGSFAEAEAPLRKAREATDPQRDPELMGMILFNQADSLARQNKPNAALPLFHEALTYAPAYPPARTGLSLLLFSLNRPQEAIDNLEQWLTDHPSNEHFEKAANLCDVVGLQAFSERYRNQMN